MTVPDPMTVDHVAEAIWKADVAAIIASEKGFDFAADFATYRSLEPSIRGRYGAIAKVAIAAHLDFINRMSRDG